MIKVKPSCCPENENGIDCHGASGVGCPNRTSRLVRSGVRWCESWCGIACAGTGCRRTNGGSDRGRTKLRVEQSKQ